MTQAEYAAWLDVTKQSAGRWQVDPVQWLNERRMLVYKGGVSGQFAVVERDGRLDLGTYEGALPHIAEALFTTAMTFKFASQDKALAWLGQHGVAAAVPLVRR